MSEGPNSTASEYLRAVRDELETLSAQMREIRIDIHDLKHCVTAVEAGLAGAHRRMDQLDHRMDRVERHLDMADA